MYLSRRRSLFLFVFVAFLFFYKYAYLVFFVPCTYHTDGSSRFVHVLLCVFCATVRTKSVLCLVLFPLAGVYVLCTNTYLVSYRGQ